MRFDKFFSTLAPVIAMAVAAGVSGCDGSHFSFNGKEGQPLADLDLSGAAPDTINMVGPDVVRISAGPDFTIAVEGEADAKERMRFLLDDGTLSIMRDHDTWSDKDGKLATVSITMPPPAKLVLAGSGEIHSDALATSAEIMIAGSGKISTPAIEVASLDVNLAGSGNYSAGGTADRLELNVAGSGDAQLAALKADRAKVKIAGSGSAAFASDGTVDARIMGSGNVTVRGSAKCTLKSFGSGTLHCAPGGTAADGEGAG
jgi:hypothetical protein